MNSIFTNLLLESEVDPNSIKLSEEVVSVTEYEIDEVEDKSILIKSLLHKQKQDLTFEDVKFIQKALEEKIAEIKVMKARIKTIEDSINEEVNLSHEQIRHKLNGVKTDNILVKKAIKRSFGKKTDTITFDMYKTALKTLETLEAEESREYSKGNW